MMNELIKFPISKRDLDKGVLAISAAKLRAMATPEMPVELSNKLIANLLGYKDLDEIERKSPSFEFRVIRDAFKRKVCASVVFRAHKIMGISVDESFEIVKHLELKNFEVLKF
jgi:hypothetical protein